MIHRQRSTERIMETWFGMMKDKRLEDITPPLAKLFQSTVLAEAFLIRRNLTLASSVSTATLTLALALEKRRHDQRPFDSSLTSRRHARPRIETLRAVEDPHRTNLNGDRFIPARNDINKNMTGPNICKFVDKRQPNDKRQSDNHQIYSTDAISSTRS
jgi:hypothetical protein